MPHHDSILVTARLIFGLGSLALLAVIMLMIRRNAIREKYALLWLPLGFAFLGAGLFPEVLLGFSARVHLHYMTVVVLVVIAVYTNILLYFTARMSQLREDVKKLSQEIALARASGEPRVYRPSGAAPADAGWLPAGKQTEGGS